MKTIPLSIIMATACVIANTLMAVGSETRLDQTNIVHSPFTVRVEAQQSEMHYKVTFQSKEGTNVSYHASLRIYRDNVLVATCPIAATNKTNQLMCEFTVAKDYTAKSRFHFTISRYGSTGIEQPSPVQYWFYLGDFANLK